MRYIVRAALLAATAMMCIAAGPAWAQSCGAVVAGGAASPPDWAADPSDGLWRNSCYVDFGSDPDVSRDDLAARCSAVPGFLQFNADHGSGHNTCVYRAPQGGTTASSPPSPVAEPSAPPVSPDADPAPPPNTYDSAAVIEDQAEHAFAAAADYQKSLRLSNQAIRIFLGIGAYEPGFSAPDSDAYGFRSFDQYDASCVSFASRFMLLDDNARAALSQTAKDVREKCNDHRVGGPTAIDVVRARANGKMVQLGLAPLGDKDPGSPTPAPERHKSQVAIGDACMIVERTETLIGCSGGAHWWWTSVKPSKRPNCPTEFSFTDDEPDAPGGTSKGDAPPRLQTCGGPATNIKPYVEVETR